MGATSGKLGQKAPQEARRFRTLNTGRAGLPADSPTAYEEGVIASLNIAWRDLFTEPRRYAARVD